jgi:hypothetical protein
MNHEMSGVAERLANEFAELPWRTILDAVSACADECEFASPMFLEQAARAALGGGLTGA